MFRAQFDVHKTDVDLVSNLSGTPQKLDFIHYLKKLNGKNCMVLSCSIFLNQNIRSGAHL